MLGWVFLKKKNKSKKGVIEVVLFLLRVVKKGLSDSLI